jgi:hypothetical protein
MRRRDYNIKTVLKDWSLWVNTGPTASGHGPAEHSYKHIVHLHPVAHCYFTFTFCFGLIWSSSGVNTCLRRLLFLFSSFLLCLF